MPSSPTIRLPDSAKPENVSIAGDLADSVLLFLEAAWGYARRGSDLTIVLFEMDEMDRVAERFGPDARSEIEKAFADLLAERTERFQHWAQSGERFFVVLGDCSRARGERFARDIADTLADAPFECGPCRVRWGVASYSSDMGSPDVLLAAADRALYLSSLSAEHRGPPDEGDAPTKTVARRQAGLDDCKVLLVDDDEATLRGTRRLLERLGCHVTPASSSREALATVTSDQDIDLLVTDIVMPEMSGFTLVEVASRARADLSVLYVSGYPQDEVYWGGTPGARSAFLGKPMELNDLDSAIRSLLDVAVDTPSQNGAAPASPTVPSAASEPAPTREGRILIVDDDEAVVGSLQRLFRRSGYATPIGVGTPARAAEEVEATRPDLIILDLHMPGMDGFQVMEQISPLVEQEEFLPILILTGDDSPEVRRRALEAGAMDFLAKPFDPAEAEARVGNLLRTRRLTQRVSDKKALLEEQVMERTAELADTRTEILHRLARAAEYRDDVTGRHAERVGLLSSLIASELGLNAREVDFLRRTAPLHDIGKIGVPDAVLRKPGRLTAEEYEAVKQHTVIGARILGGSSHRILEMASRIARGHHERWDGRGYPDGLGEEDIPLEARIVSVADVFDVLSHSRPYKDAVAPAETIGRIVQDRGTHFDPTVTDALCAIFDRVGPDGFMELSDPIDPLRDIRPDTLLV